MTNMEASLEVPTATSVRAIPAKLMVDNRIVINNHLARGRGGKISFTHLIGYAMVEALAEMPAMNTSYTVVDDKPSVLTPAHVNVGIAIDLAKPDGTRQLLVPSIKKSETLDFAGFWSAYEDVVRRARGNKLTVDDFAGTTISLTNPGTIGTVHSVPRLMQGQGTIIGVGAMDYPAEFAGTSEDALNKMGVSKVLTLTSTYDHRIIQGAQSGDFLRIIGRKLLGEDGFYDRVFAALRVPYEPVRWVRESADPDAEAIKPARIAELIHSYRSRGHLMADTDPLAYRQRKHPDLDVQTHGLTLWDLDRTFPTGGFGGKPRAKLREVLGLLRDSYCRTVGSEYMHLQDPRQRSGSRSAWSPGTPARRARTSCASCAGSTRRRPSRPSCRPSTSARSGSRSRAASRSSPCSTRSCPRRRQRSRRGRHRHGAPRPAEHPGEHRRQVLRRRSSRVRGQPGPQVGPGLGRREVPPGHRGHVHRRVRRDHRGVPGGQPVAPRGRGPGARGHRARQAGPHRPGRRRLLRAADPHPRRRGLRRPGRRVRDAEPGAAARVPHRRHHPRDHQQPGRLHHRPSSSRSSQYATDVAKGLQVPIFHVNGDDPEACVRVAELAFEYREQFDRDVIIDMVELLAVLERELGHPDARLGVVPVDVEDGTCRPLATSVASCDERDDGPW